MPFNAKTPSDRITLIKNGEFDTQNLDEISAEAQDLIKLLLSVDPDQRPSAEKALQHPWFMRKKVGKIKSTMSALT